MAVSKHFSKMTVSNVDVADCSEPETALMLALTNSFMLHVWLNMVSGMEGVFMAYEHLAVLLSLRHLSSSMLESTN